MSTAQELDRVLARFLEVPATPLPVRAWDGSRSAPAAADVPAELVVHRAALTHLVWSPNELGLARAYVSGDLGIEGDLDQALAALHLLRIRDRAALPPVADYARLLGTAARLGALGRRPPPPPEEARVGALGRRHSAARDAAAVQHHYDVGNEFYQLLLGPTLVYSCAYWQQPPSAGYGLDQAQRAKLDLVCRKLGLRPGDRLLDVGCGWGSLVLHAAREYGVHALGVTLSPAQALLAQKRAAEQGLADRVEIRVQDYRQVQDGPFDAVASVGMAEHVGEANLGVYARRVHHLLAPRGRLLHHVIGRPHGPRRSTRHSFIERYVFPDGELLPLGTTVTVLQAACLEVRDVQALREHYVDTLRAWRSNLDAGWARAVELVGERRARVWRLYLTATALGFATGRTGVDQVLAVRPDPDGRSGMPRMRAESAGVGEPPVTPPPRWLPAQGG